MSEDSLDGEVIAERRRVQWRRRNRERELTGEKNSLLGRAPEREQDEREAKGKQGTSPPPPHPIPHSQQPSPFTRLFRKLLAVEVQGKTIGGVFV